MENINFVRPSFHLWQHNDFCQDPLSNSEPSKRTFESFYWCSLCGSCMHSDENPICKDWGLAICRLPVDWFWRYVKEESFPC